MGGTLAGMVRQPMRRRWEEGRLQAWKGGGRAQIKRGAAVLSMYLISVVVVS